MGVTESKTRNLLAAFILLKHLSGATITIDKSLAEVKTGDTLMINCTVSELSEDVIFKRNGNEIGRCGAPVPIPVNLCPDGFNQDQSTNITTYNVMSANASSDEGTWTCEHSPESSAALPIIVYGFPTSPVNDNQAYLPNSVDATNMDDIQLYVNISECVNPAPTFKWTFYKNCDGTTITSSNLITSTNSKDLDIACSPPYSAYKSTIKVTDMRKVVGNDDYCYNVRCVVEYPETSFSQISVPFLTNITFTGTTTSPITTSTTTTTTTLTIPPNKCLNFIEAKSCVLIYIIFGVLVIFLLSSVGCLIKWKRNQRHKQHRNPSCQGHGKKKNNSDNQEMNAQNI